MDRLTHYKNLVRTALDEIAQDFSRSDWKIIKAYDETRGQYLLFTDNWKGSSRQYGCFMHLEVNPNGKIYLHRDGTDLDIGQQLLDEGVPKSDMVIGFHSPAMRAMTDFAQS